MIRAYRARALGPYRSFNNHAKKVPPSPTKTIKFGPNPSLTEPDWVGHEPYLTQFPALAWCSIIDFPFKSNKVSILTISSTHTSTELGRNQTPKGWTKSYKLRRSQQQDKQQGARRKKNFNQKDLKFRVSFEKLKKVLQWISLLFLALQLHDIFIIFIVVTSNWFREKVKELGLFLICREYLTYENWTYSCF